MFDLAQRQPVYQKWASQHSPCLLRMYKVINFVFLAEMKIIVHGVLFNGAQYEDFFGFYN